MRADSVWKSAIPDAPRTANTAEPDGARTVTLPTTASRQKARLVRTVSWLCVVNPAAALGHNPVESHFHAVILQSAALLLASRVTQQSSCSTPIISSLRQMNDVLLRTSLVGLQLGGSAGSKCPLDLFLAFLITSSRSQTAVSSAFKVTHAFAGPPSTAYPRLVS